MCSKFPPLYGKLGIRMLGNIIYKYRGLRSRASEEVSPSHRISRVQGCPLDVKSQKLIYMKPAVVKKFTKVYLPTIFRLLKRNLHCKHRDSTDS